ncbi:response regulator [Chryseolinea soli]|uniref:Response regulator n=1 Tax=Chryseolinea soli TaxID=2321403 RepID=A0A385SFQ0_9BACT|nr:response regulator [Chryseolinea soli]AYB29744.1 response regulator [Chryseolinea soli]
MSKARILIVEDSFIVAYHLQATLEGEGYTVLEKFDSGSAAIEYAEHSRPDLVLMDIMLNGEMDGIQTASILKSRFNLPVIYITALTDRDTIQRAKITEPYGYLTKPFEDREIFTVIEMALYKHEIESKLRQSEEKYFATVKSISDAIVIIDDQYTISYLNPKAESITGYALPDALGRNVADIMHLRNEATGEFPVNPIQCDIVSQHNALPEGLLLGSRQNVWIPIGEGSLSPVIDARGRRIGLVMIFKDLSEKRANEKMAKDFEKQRLSALIEGQEKERSRIAKDLHDGLGQILNAVKMNVNVLVTDKRTAQDLYQLLDEAIMESIRISENLLPSKLKDFDLATCLRSMCRQMNETVNIPISFQSMGVPVPLEQAHKVNLYRIAQEAVTNAIKHAHASSITVRLSERPQAVRLSIEDNGKGICPAKDDRNHSGLVNMRDRAEILQGKLSVKPGPEGGTIVMIETPVHPN